MATFDTQINSWVNAVQFHDATAAQLALYNAQLSAGTSNQTVQFNIISEGQTLAYTNPVVRMYQAAFGRIPDLGGQKGWVNQLQTGANTIPAMGNWFAGAPEFANLYNGANASTPANKVLVDAFYINVLQRAPDAQGEAFWINSGLKAGQLLTAFSESAEFIGTSLPYAQGLQQLNIQQQYPTNVFQNLFSGPTYQQVISGQVGFQLTPNADTATANQFNGNYVTAPATLAIAQTITTGDNLTGTGTNATLRGQVGINGLAVITTNNISTFTLQATAGAVVNGNINGLTTLNNTNSVNSLALQNVNTALTNLNLSGILGGAPSTTTVTFGSAATFTATSSLAIGVSGGSNSGAVTLNTAGATGYATLALSSTGGATNTVAALASNNNVGAVDTTLTIAGDTALKLNAVDTTLTTINAGALTAGGAAFSGNLNLGSAGAGLGLTGTATVTGGSGTNKIFVGNLGTNYTINGGTGANNTLVLTTTAGVAGGTVSGFKTLELAASGVVSGNNSGTGYGATNAALTLSGVTGLSAIQLDGAAAGVNTGTVTIVSLPLTSNALAFNLVGNGLAAGGESFNAVTFAGLAGTTNTLTETISNQGVSVGSNAIGVGAQNLQGFGTATFTVVDAGASSTTTFGTITDTNLTSAKFVTPGNIALTAGGVLAGGANTLTTLDLSGVVGTEAIPAVAVGATPTGFSLLTGAGNATVAAFTAGAAETTLTVNAAGNLNFTAFTSGAALTTETFTETGGSTKAIVVLDHLETVLTTLSLAGNVSYISNAGAAISTPGAIVVTGATDNANVGLNHTIAAANADIITLGNGNNVITDASTGAVNITLGTGFSTVTLGSAPAAAQTITFGAHTSTGAAATTLAGNVFTVGTIDSVVLTANGASTTNFATINGAVTNDTINSGVATAAAIIQVAANTDANAAAFIARVAAPVANTAYIETIGGTTYEFVNGAGGAWGAGDNIISTTGTHTFGIAAGVLTLLS